MPRPASEGDPTWRSIPAFAKCEEFASAPETRVPVKSSAGTSTFNHRVRHTASKCGEIDIVRSSSAGVAWKNCRVVLERSW